MAGDDVNLEFDVLIWGRRKGGRGKKGIHLMMQDTVSCVVLVWVVSQKAFSTERTGSNNGTGLQGKGGVENEK